MKKILILKGKHGTRYLDLSDTTKEHEAYKKAFQENKNSGYYETLEKNECDSEINRLSDEINEIRAISLASLPKVLRTKAEEAKANIECLTSELSTLTNMRELYINAKKNDIAAIKELMRLRKDYEYEEFVVEDVE